MRLALIAVLACGACLALAGPAAANTFNVTKTADTQDGACDTDCSLREALHAADTNGQDDTISVPAGHYLLSLGELTVDSNVSIVGENARTTVIDAGGNSRVFDVESGTVGMSHLTVTGGSGTGGSGNDGEGGGIFNDGILILDSSTVDGNVAPNQGFFGGQGGGIFNNDDLTVTNSSISNNIADGTGAAGSGGQGGGIFANDVVRLTNTTISGQSGEAGYWQRRPGRRLVRQRKFDADERDDRGQQRLAQPGRRDRRRLHQQRSDPRERDHRRQHR